MNRRAFIAAGLTAFVAQDPGSTLAAPTADWRRISASGKAGARWDHTLSALSNRKQLLLAFGRDNAGVALGDCWINERSSGAWEPLSATGPAPRFGHAATTDDSSGLMYLFGGQQGEQFFNDLWVLDLDAGSWELLHDGAGPSPRYGTSLVLDGEQSLYVSHGFTFDGRFDDTWRFDLSTGQWEDRSPSPDSRPLRRCLHESVWDTATGSMWLYGGCSSGFGPCPQNDLWQFEPQSGTWRFVTSSGPPGRTNPSLTFDRAGDRFLLVGGLTADGAANDVWIGSDPDEFMWQPLPPASEAPQARSSHDAVISGGALYLYGGLGVDGALGDLWRLKIAP